MGGGWGCWGVPRTEHVTLGLKPHCAAEVSGGLRLADDDDDDDRLDLMLQGGACIGLLVRLHALQTRNINTVRQVCHAQQGHRPPAHRSTTPPHTPAQGGNEEGVEELAAEVLDLVERTRCSQCLLWSKSDALVR